MTAQEELIDMLKDALSDRKAEVAVLRHESNKKEIEIIKLNAQLSHARSLKPTSLTEKFWLALVSGLVGFLTNALTSCENITSKVLDLISRP